LKYPGYSGGGFQSVGKRVAVNVSHDLPIHRLGAQVQAAEAAERIAKQLRLLAGPGRTLGGLKGLNFQDSLEGFAENTGLDGRRVGMSSVHSCE
jgi:hypothetical protein